MKQNRFSCPHCHRQITLKELRSRFSCASCFGSISSNLDSVVVSTTFLSQFLFISVYFLVPTLSVIWLIIVELGIIIIVGIFLVTFFLKIEVNGKK